MHRIQLAFQVVEAEIILEGFGFVKASLFNRTVQLLDGLHAVTEGQGQKFALHKALASLQVETQTLLLHLLRCRVELFGNVVK
jgi:hypothetical protein